MIYVILLEPVTAGNVGAVARSMANFGFSKLVLINPHCDHLGDEARRRAKHAQHILDEAEVADFFIVDDYDYLVATTARLGTDYNIPRSPMLPSELGVKLKKIDPSKKIGLVIGRETHGMFNEEIARCDFIVTIPSHGEYPTLNISHAVVVLLYELHKAFSSTDITKHITPIGKAEKDQIIKMFRTIFDKMQWETKEKRETQELLWKKVLGKSMLTKREAYGVMGFLRKVLWGLGNKVEVDVPKKSVTGSINKNKPSAKTKPPVKKAPSQKKAPVKPAKNPAPRLKHKATKSSMAKDRRPKKTKPKHKNTAPKSSKKK